jgi:hypothetical protein
MKERKSTMLNPIGLTAPQALLVLIALAVYAELAMRWVNRPLKPPLPVARHRLATTATPYRPRDWDTVAAAPVGAQEPGAPRRLVLIDPLDARMTLADVEMLAGRLEETRLRSGSTIWSWSDQSWAASTRELEAIR